VLDLHRLQYFTALYGAHVCLAAWPPWAPLGQSRLLGEITTPP
jgi:hypothetical protein